MATLPLLLRALHTDRLRGGPGPVRTVGTRIKKTLQLQPCEETGILRPTRRWGWPAKQSAGSARPREGPPHASIAQRSAGQETVRQIDATFLPGPTSCRFCCFLSRG